jgi:hypothetical protein
MGNATVIASCPVDGEFIGGVAHERVQVIFEHHLFILPDPEK